MQSCMIQIPSVFQILAVFSIEHIVSTFSHAVVDRLGVWFGGSLIWSELVRGTLLEPVGCSASESLSR
jgi:purine-cytosine permease-like protein